MITTQHNNIIEKTHKKMATCQSEGEFRGGRCTEHILRVISLEVITAQEQ